MRFVTFNISSARSSRGRVDTAALATAIAELDADVLALQEVDRDQPRSDLADLTQIAADAMGAASAVFAPALYGTPGERWERAGEQPRGGPAYGCALLSRQPFTRTQVLRMPAAPLSVPLWIPGPGVMIVKEEPRVAIFGQLELDGGGPLTVIGTHLPFVPGWNRRQLRRVVREAEGWPGPLLLLGDLNLRGGVPARLTGYTSLVQAPTFPAAKPRMQLDHILFRGDLDHWGTVRASSTPVLGVSDHRPQVVDIEPGS